MLFPWLSEVEQVVLAKIDQKRSEPGDPGVGDDELNHVFNAEHRYLWERLSSMDRDFGITVDDTVTVSAGDQTTALPTDLRVLRQVYQLRGGEVCRLIEVGSWHELQGSCHREALYQPDAGSPQIYWVKKPTSDMTLRLVYGAYAPHLFHSCVLSAGSTTVALPTYETSTDSSGVSRNILVDQGPGAGQERTVSSYSGADREITVSAAFSSGLPTSRSHITSRPALPPDFFDAFVYGSCARLVEKYQDMKFAEFTAQRAEKLQAAYTALNTLDRRGPLETYDMDDFGHGDPDWDWGF